MANIVINSLGIQDSGGITVFEKVLQEVIGSSYKVLVVCNQNKNTEQIIKKFEPYENIEFKYIPTKGILYRLYYENVVFRKIIKQYNIDLVYNFSGSAQFFLKTPQLTKVHNLLFYSKAIDRQYFQHQHYFQWFKQVFLKRIVFHSMIKKTKYIEVQSEHVKAYMGDFLDLFFKQFFLKSDIDLDKQLFLEPKNYDFSKKVRFFYIVGPHFEALHKNFEEFVKAMVLLKHQQFDFEILITLTQEQLHKSVLWDRTLDENTTFLGYISKNEIEQQFQDNTVMISTSVIETLGLHVIEATQNSTIVIVPDELYSRSVYGKDVVTYELYNPESLVKKIQELALLDNKTIQDIIQKNQNYLIENEKNKYHSVVEIFDEILKGGNV